MRKTRVSKWVLLILPLSLAASLLAIRGVGAAATITDLLSVPSADGTDPQFVMQSPVDGNLYGTVYRGGGSVFSVSPSGVYTLLHKFVSDPVSGHYLDGEFPTAVVDPGNTFIYGIADSGGPITRPRNPWLEISIESASQAPTSRSCTSSAPRRTAATARTQAV